MGEDFLACLKALVSQVVQKKIWQVDGKTRSLCCKSLGIFSQVKIQIFRDRGYFIVQLFGLHCSTFKKSRFVFFLSKYLNDIKRVLKPGELNTFLWCFHAVLMLW